MKCSGLRPAHRVLHNEAIVALLLRHQRPAWAGGDKPAMASRRLELVLLATQEMSLERILISAKPWKKDAFTID